MYCMQILVHECVTAISVGVYVNLCVCEYDI